jgi:hypothetical protein
MRVSMIPALLALGLVSADPDVTGDANCNAAVHVA